MSTPVIAIIGAGNMGSSLIGGLIQKEHPRHHLWAADQNEHQLMALKERYGIQTTLDNKKAAENADAVILAVKPNLCISIAQALHPVINNRQPLIISIAAGISVVSLQKALPDQTAIVRAMPNIAALINQGASGAYANAHVTEAQHAVADMILRATGLVVWVNDENLIHVITALSGSGPAYFFLVIDAMQKAAKSLGLPEETARLLAAQTALGAAQMILQGDTSVTDLIKRVASPGGTTEKALSVLESEKIREIFQKTLEAATLRSRELAKD